TWQNNIPKASAKLWKNNLACLTMLRAKDSQLAFSFNYENSVYDDKSTRIHEILETKFTPLVAHRLKELGVFFIYQLVDKEGDKMITWRQLNLMKRGNAKGRPANWFKRLETEMIEEPSCRIIKPEFKVAAPNRWRIKAQLDKLSDDARRKDWVIINKPVQEEEDIVVGRIVSRTLKVLQIEHWIASFQPEKQKSILE